MGQLRKKRRGEEREAGEAEKRERKVDEYENYSLDAHTCQDGAWN